MGRLTDEERWFWHAYDYGWRIVQHNDLTRRSPIDPDGQWFDEHLAWTAELWWRDVTGKRKPPAPLTELERAALAARASEAIRGAKQAIERTAANLAARQRHAQTARRPAREADPPDFAADLERLNSTLGWPEMIEDADLAAEAR
jgi:hypothetical protein